MRKRSEYESRTIWKEYIFFNACLSPPFLVIKSRTDANQRNILYLLLIIIIFGLVAAWPAVPVALIVKTKMRPSRVAGGHRAAGLLCSCRRVGLCFHFKALNFKFVFACSMSFFIFHWCSL